MIFRGKSIKTEFFGESHSESIGAKIYGFPSNFEIDFEKLKRFTERRKAKNELSTARHEDDEPIFVSGIENGKTNGETIEFHIKNNDVRHNSETFIPRPGHADYPAYIKYGKIPEGGGAFSGRMTAAVCVVGGIFIQYLMKNGIHIKSHINSVKDIFDEPFMQTESFDSTEETSDFPVNNAEIGEKMKEAILKAKSDGDSLGGTVECAVSGVKAGLGGALFDGLESVISYAVFAIPGVKGIEFGSGFSGSTMLGSENNDGYFYENGEVKTYTNNAGGILGGMATGCAPIIFKVAFKPVPSIVKEQKSIDLSTKTNTTVKCIGRNDPCIVPRATAVVEAMTAIALTDTIISEKL